MKTYIHPAGCLTIGGVIKTRMMVNEFPLRICRSKWKRGELTCNITVKYMILCFFYLLCFISVFKVIIPTMC